jgi:hypothetical protein
MKVKSKKWILNMNKSKDWLSRIIAIISMLVAMISIWYTYSINKEEIIEIHWVNTSSNNKIKLTDVLIGDTNHSKILIPEEFIIANQSNIKSRIISVKLSPIPSPSIFGSSYILYDESDKKIQLPISLDAGESKRVKIYTAMRIDGKLHKAIKDINKSYYGKSSLKYQLASKYKLDLFSNVIEGVQSMHSEDNNISPKFGLTIKTRRHKEFIKFFHDYMLP